MVMLNVVLVFVRSMRPRETQEMNAYAGIASQAGMCVPPMAKRKHDKSEGVRAGRPSSKDENIVQFVADACADTETFASSTELAEDVSDCLQRMYERTASEANRPMTATMQ